MATSQSQHLSQPHIIHIINKLNKETNQKEKKKKKLSLKQKYNMAMAPFLSKG